MIDDDFEIFYKILVPLGFIAGLGNGFLFLWLMVNPPPGEKASNWTLFLILIISWGGALFAYERMKNRFGWFQGKDKN